MADMDDEQEVTAAAPSTQVDWLEQDLWLGCKVL